MQGKISLHYTIGSLQFRNYKIAELGTIIRNWGKNEYQFYKYY